MKKLTVLAVVLVFLMLVMFVAGCGGKGGDADPGWDEPGSFEEDEGYDDPNDITGGDEFYDVYAEGLRLMGLFKELEFSHSSVDSNSEFRAGASFSLVGEETVDGQKTRHFACTYFESSNGNETEGKLEVWVNENFEPVQALVDGALLTGSEVLPATNEFDYVLSTLGSDRFAGVRSEKELKERIETEWNIEKSSRETRDLGFGSIEVTRYELSQLFDPKEFDTSRADNLVFEYTRVGSKILFTKWVDAHKWLDSGYESVTEITVERVIPY